MKKQAITAFCLAGLTMLASVSLASAEEPKKSGWSVVGAERMDVSILQGGTPRFGLGNVVWGPAWKWPRLDQFATVTNGGVRVYEQAAVGFYESIWAKQPIEGRFDLHYELRQAGPDTVRMRYTCRPEFETAFGIPGKADEKTLTVGPRLFPSAYFDCGEAMATFTDGTTEAIALPPPRGTKTGVAALALRTAGGEETRLTFDPAVMFHMDVGELRIFASQKVKAGEPFTQTITMKLPGATAFEPANRFVDASAWFPLNLAQINDFGTPSHISMEGWQEKPAGKRGWVQSKGDHFEFADGTPVKFWGVNPLKMDGTVSEEYLAKSAAALERLGVNLVRFHAFGRPNTREWAHMLKIQDVDDGLKFNPVHLHLFDYGYAKMREHGIYHNWSVFYGWYPTPADKTRLLNYEEASAWIGTMWKGSMSCIYAMTAVMPDVQDLIIQFHVNLLNHTNELTGLRYADDPALLAVELQNEEDFFLNMWNYDSLLTNAPTYRKLIYGKFADWLKTRYASQEALAGAWGAKLQPGEQLAAANISPFPKWYPDKPTQRTADQLHFLYAQQRDYYKRFETAVRKTGYKGQLIGSCWQAADFVGHLYNVLSDREIGHIDRHNYGASFLDQPGVGLLSAGFQAVGDRPFSFSEWGSGIRGINKTIDVPLVAVYGMGLQDWDASLQFSWDHVGVLPRKSDHGGNSCNDFGALSQYPAVARLVRRGDVRPGAVIGRRRVSLPALKATGDVGFTEAFSLLNAANNKSFGAAVPNAALAAGRVVLEFVDGPVEKPVVDDSAACIDAESRVVRSTTGQLAWDYAGKGFFTVNTPGTKAVVGHAGGRRLELGQVTLTPQTPFSSIYVSALGPTDAIANARSLLVTALARSQQAGAQYEELREDSSGPFIAAPDKNAPVLVEPVSAAIEIKREDAFRVFALDHGGRKPADALEIPVVKSGGVSRFTVDGSKTKTFYYVVEFTE